MRTTGVWLPYADHYRDGSSKKMRRIYSAGDRRLLLSFEVRLAVAHERVDAFHHVVGPNEVTEGL